MDRTTDSSNETKSLPLVREVDFAKQKTEGENISISLPQSACSADSPLDEGALIIPVRMHRCIADSKCLFGQSGHRGCPAQ